jgi:Kef-type K+ transport system membrane component KefB
MHALIPGPEADPQGNVAAALMTISQLGVLLYMFLVGLELNAAKLRHQAHAAVFTSHASIIAPFLLGSTLALWLYPILSHRGVPFTSFALFMGVAMSITAFPVLARILTDRDLQFTSTGVMALACAAADDVTAWCLLALVVGVAKAQLADALVVSSLALAYIAVMFLLIRPVVASWCRQLDAHSGGLPQGAIAAGFVGVLAASLITELIGVHAVFGAFLLGAVIPHESRLAQEFTAKLREPVTVLLLPAFFAYTGMRTQIGLVSGWENWLLCGVIVLVATIGKFGGTLLAARLTGHNWRDAAALGVLMNTRGLMELIVLNIGLDLGVISPKLFAMMVLMALATTVATAPILRLLLPDKASRVPRDHEEA